MADTLLVKPVPEDQPATAEWWVVEKLWLLGERMTEPHLHIRNIDGRRADIPLTPNRGWHYEWKKGQ